LVASRIVSTTAAGWETLSVWEAPTISRTPCALVRSAMKRCKATGMLRSWSLTTNQDGIVFQAGFSVARPVARAS
jgi:hypothetical protein